MAVFPSRHWVEEVMKVAAKSEAYKEASHDWEGDFLCVIECDEEFLLDLRRKEVIDGFISFLDMMPADSRRKYAGTPMGRLLEHKLGIPVNAPVKGLDPNELVARLSKLTVGDMTGATVYFWADFWHGTVRSMTAVAPGEHEDAAFRLSGKYSSWKLLVSGQQDTMRLVMSNRLQLKGDMQYVMKRMKAIVALTREVLSGVPID